MRLSYVLAPAIVGLVHLPNAAAQYRCDCTTVVDTCGAEVVARGTFLEIKTNAPQSQCARVDYFVDGQPFVSMVAGGEHRENWLARTTEPRVLVQSCQVCASGSASTAPAAPANTAAPAEGEGGLEPLIASVPEYPQAAGGARGFAEVEFTVTAEGTVEGARVVAAEPRNVFDAAAVAAVARRRYPADPAREPQALKERIEFQPPSGGAAARPSAASGPRNQCVRQDAVYNYGEMVDVGLINACPEPLVVYGCAPGIGRNFGRFVCSTSEERGDVLVAAGDQRVGRRYATGSAADFRAYTYTSSFSVTRPPNSQYWWIACAENDAQCRSDARLWTRAVSGQSASVDPEARSPIAVASSD
jgi:TonB family protein